MSAPPNVRCERSPGFAVIAFVNGTTHSEDVVDAATSAFLGVPEAPPEQVPADTASWADYVGRYEDTTGALGKFTVFVDGRSLRAERHRLRRARRGSARVADT